MHEAKTENEVVQIVAEVQHPAEEAPQAEGAPQLDVLEAKALALRLGALEERLHAVEVQLHAQLAKAKQTVEAAAAPPRRSASAPRMLAKGAEPAGAAGVDAALGSLSVEQRMAVKAGLLRAGLL